MLPIMNTDLNSMPRKDTKMFVFELCMYIYHHEEYQTNLPISYVASLESHVHGFYDGIPHDIRTGHPMPR